MQRHRDAVYRFVCSYLGAAREEAEDVTQDVLVEVYRSLPGFEGRSRLLTWILGVARNLCLRRRRTAQRRPETGTDEPEALRDLPDLAFDLDAVFERQELQERVRAAIEGLGPEHRDVVWLREIEGLSYAEIAAVLVIPLGTVRSRLHNARAVLIETLAPRASERERCHGVR